MKRRLIGVVVSDKMDKTATVQVNVVKEHPLYAKKVRGRKKFHADNPDNKAKMGQEVEIEEIAPMSKTKTWRIIRIIEEAA